MSLATEQAYAASLKAINCAKHKAAGKTHRLQLEIYGPRGGYRETVVIYLTGEPTVESIARRLTDRKSSRTDTYTLEVL